MSVGNRCVVFIGAPIDTPLGAKTLEGCTVDGLIFHGHQLIWLEVEALFMALKPAT
jgi:hypothetical protein